MILYAEDWLKYPYAIVDYKTKNRSFVQLSMTLAAMGIKNNLFFLALMDETLQGVDPRSPDLTSEQKIRIQRECANNPWYFLREIARISVDGTSEGIPVIANRGLIALWWCINNNFDVYSMQPRQTGKSVGVDFDHLYKNTFSQYNANSVLVTKDRKLVVKNTERLKKMRELLPSYLYYKTNKDKDVEDIFNYAARRNTLTLYCAQNDEASARNVGRGFTTSRLHIDEVPFVKYIDILLPAASASMDTAIFQAMQSGEPYGRVYTTTAGDLSTREGKYAYELFVRGFRFYDELYDCKNRDELANIMFLNTGLPNPQMSILYYHRQLGMSDEEMWRRINSVASTDEDINKDYFLKWGKGGKHSVIPEDVLRDMDDCVRQPDYNQLTDMGYVIRWYIKQEDLSDYMKNNPVVMGVDTSEQIGRDSTAFVMINPYTLELVGCITIKSANILRSAKWLAAFMLEHSNITMIIEKKSSAQTFIDSLIVAFIAAGINPFKRIWNHVNDNPNLNQNLFHAIRRNGYLNPREIDEHRRYFGFNQSGSTRELLYSKVLSQAAKQSRHVLYDDALVNQIGMLKTNKDGRLDHISGEHDDLVMAFCLAHWMMRYGKNLEYYGIDSRKVMFGVTEEGEQLTEDNLIDIDIAKRLSEERAELIAEYKRNLPIGVRMRLEKKISLISEELTRYGVEAKTLDALLKENDDKRAEKSRARIFK